MLYNSCHEYPYGLNDKLNKQDHSYSFPNIWAMFPQVCLSLKNENEKRNKRYLVK